ncbi:MAG: hypothetical protein HZB63_09250 [Deltaproteobacteria bacterium]|nr:hypothetical protein [Deltaproteobacteria bacterium]
MNRPGFVIPALALAALFFGWRAYEAWTGPIRTAGVVSSAPAAVPIGVSTEEAAPPSDLSALAASVGARPVFRPDRQPYREDAAGQSKRNYDAEISRFTLLGVLLLGNDKKGVVVGKGTAGRSERWEVAPGDALPGFLVKEIGSDGITLAADEREFLLPLYAGGPKGPPAQGAVRTEVAPARPSASPAQPVPPKQAGSAGPAAQPARATPPPAVAPPPAAGAPTAAELESNRARLRRQRILSPIGR